MSKAVEMHYTATEIGLLIRKSVQFVKKRLLAGEFGADVFLVGGEYCAPASAVNEYMERHRVVTPGIAARTEGEFRRKAGAL